MQERMENKGLTKPLQRVSEQMYVIFYRGFIEEERLPLDDQLAKILL